MASNSHQTAGNDIGNHTSVHTPSGRLETTCCDPLQNATSDGGNEGGIFPGNHHHDAIKADSSLPAHPHIQSDLKFPHHQNSSHQANQPRQIPVRVEGGDVSKKGFQIHREEIRSLYLDQNLTLHEVMEHMRRKGFRATLRMYKKQLKAWNYHKNVRRQDIDAMIHAQNCREGAVGKGTTFYVSGKEFNLNRRLGSSQVPVTGLATIGSGDVHGMLPAWITFRTPSPEPYPPRLPDDQKLKEIVLHWFDEPESKTIVSLNYPIIRTYHQGLRYFSDQEWEKGGFWLRLAFQSLPELISAPSPIIIFKLACLSVSYPDPGVYIHFWKFVASYMTIALPEEHYLRRLSVAAMQCLDSMDVANHIQILSDTMSTVLSDNPQLIFPASLEHAWNAPYPGCPGKVIIRCPEKCSLEALVQATIRDSASLLGIIRHRISILEGLGRSGGWYSDVIYRAALALLRLMENMDYTSGLLRRRQHCLIIVALHHKARFDANPSTNNPRMRLAISFLERAILLEPEYDNGSFDLQDQIQLLKAWYQAIDDSGGVQRCRDMQERYEKKLLEQMAEGRTSL